MINRWHDLRYAIRQLGKSPGFTVTAVPAAESLYGIERANDKALGHSSPNFVDLRDRNRTFDALTGYGVIQAALDTGTKPILTWGIQTAQTTLTLSIFSRMSGAFFTAPMTAAPTALLTWFSVTPTADER